MNNLSSHLDHLGHAGGHFTPAPTDRLRFFRTSLGIDEAMAARIAPHGEAFAARAPQLAEHLYARFTSFAQTKLLLDKESGPGRLKASWERWFKAMWTRPLEDSFVNMVWRSGVIHVALGIDQRFVNLAFSHARNFCHDLTLELVPPEEHIEVLRAVDALIDFNILVETDSLVSSTQRCETEVIMGVAHQLRNPLMVIGAGANRLGRSRETCDAVSDVTGAIVDEALRIERMLKSVAEYTRLMQQRPQFVELRLADVVQSALQELQTREDFPVDIQVNLEQQETVVEADPAFLTPMLREVLLNGLEAALQRTEHDEERPRQPWLRISSTAQGATTGFVVLNVDNSGPEPDPELIETLFEPFHSTKPMGTGFGLAVARLAAKKCLGSLSLAPLPKIGARVAIQLALPGTIKESEFFAGD